MQVLQITYNNGLSVRGKGVVIRKDWAVFKQENITSQKLLSSIIYVHLCSKNKTMFLMTSWTRIVCLQQFLVHLLPRV